MRLNKGEICIYILAIILYILSIRLTGPIDWDPDFWSYLKAWDQSFSHGVIDKFRTPLYPIYLGLMKIIWGSQYFKLAAIIGHFIVYALSIHAFYLIAHRLTNSSRIGFWTTLFYSTFPGIIYWNNSLMTESFAVAGSVFLFLLIIKLYDKFSFLLVVLITLLIILLLMLRPIFVYLLPILFLAWIIALKKQGKKKQAVYGLISTFTASLALVAYMAVFNHAYGVFSTSSVSTYNRWYIARESGFLNPEVIDNPALRSDVEKSINNYGKQFDFNKGNLWHETDTIFEKYDLATLNHVLDNSTTNQPFSVFAKVIDTTIKASTHKFVAPGSDISITLADLMGLNMATIYLILILYSILLVKWIFSHKDIPWFSSLLFMAGISNLIVVLIGAQGEWYRLVLPSVPIYILLTGQLLLPLNLKRYRLIKMI